MEILDPGLIGGFLLPVLGAVPDAAVILVSCLGPISVVKEQLVIIIIMPRHHSPWVLAPWPAVPSCC